MRTLLAGDNSSNLNWGGRAASLALHETLSSAFDIVGTVPGSTLVTPCLIDTLLPRRYVRLLDHAWQHRTQRRVFEYYVRVEELWGARDFVAADPAQTARDMLAHRDRCPELRAIVDRVQEAELVVVHGEGDIVFSSPPRRPALLLLGIAELGLRLRKKVVVVNSIVSDCTVTGRNAATVEHARRVFSQCDAVIVRDHASLEYVRTHMPAARTSYVPDALFAWHAKSQRAVSSIPDDGDLVLAYPEDRRWFGRLDFSRPYVCIAGSAVAGRDRERSVASFGALAAALRTLGLDVYLAEACTGDAFLQDVAAAGNFGLIPAGTAIRMVAAILANARLLVSGRYHPSILASLGGTPCVFLGSNAHKMTSLQQVLEYPACREFPVHAGAADIDAIATLARGYLEQGEALRTRIREVARRRADEALRLPQRIADVIGPTASAAQRRYAGGAPTRSAAVTASSGAGPGR